MVPLVSNDPTGVGGLTLARRRRAKKGNKRMAFESFLSTSNRQRQEAQQSYCYDDE